MKLTSEIIQKNLLTLEQAKKSFPVLQQYSEKYALKIKFFNEGNLLTEYWENENSLRLLREEGRNYKLNIYLDFIDYIGDCEKYGQQQVFYRKKIQNKELQKVLVDNSLDEEAKLCFKNKTKSTFAKFINSKKWALLSNDQRSYRRRSKTYNNNLSRSSAIIANYCIQNEIEILEENYVRIKEWFRTLIPEPDYSIAKEIDRTATIIDFIVNKLGENNSDFRKINIDHLTISIKNELSKKVLSLQKAEKIRCLEVSAGLEGELTINKIYEVKDTRIEYGVLKVEIRNDKDNSKFYFYRNFETVTTLRDNFISSILDEL